MKIDTKEVTLVKTQSTKALNAAMELEIKTDEDYQRAGELKLKLKQLGKLIKDGKERITKPLNEALANVREMFSPAEGSFKTASQLVDRKMLNYDEMKEAEAAKEREKITAKVESGYLKPETADKKLEAVEDAPKGTKNESGSVFVKKIKNVRITDESLIPREYLVIDMVKLRRAILTEGKQIPGAEMFEERTMGSRLS